MSVDAEREWWDALDDQASLVNTAGVPPYDVERVAEAIRHRFQIYEPHQILEIGCGEGRLTKKMRDICPTAHVVGVDFSPRMIRRAKIDAGPRLQFAVNDGETLPYPDRFFDAAYSVTVFQHLPEDVVRGYLAEARRVLRPDGAFVFTYSEGTQDAFLHHQVHLRQMLDWTIDAGFARVLDHGRDRRGWSWMSARTLMENA